jgi:hypothetical protein
VYLLVFHAYINEMHGSRSKIPSKNYRIYIHDVKSLTLLGALHIYNISRLWVKVKMHVVKISHAIYNIFRDIQAQTTVHQKVLLSYTLDLNPSGCNYTVH